MSETPHRHGPQDEGIPDYADDTSTAFDESDHPRFEAPAAMPGDEPQGIDEHGTTAAEAREGEPLEQRLAREEPDPAEAPWPEGGGALVDEVVDEDTETQAAQDADVLGTPAGPAPRGGPGASGFDPASRRSTRGRLVEPDEGAHPDTEPAMLADDRGGRGYAAEEAAMHMLPEEETYEGEAYEGEAYEGAGPEEPYEGGEPDDEAYEGDEPDEQPGPADGARDTDR